MGQHHTQRAIRRLVAVTAALALVAGIGSTAAAQDAPPEGNTIQPDSMIVGVNGGIVTGNNVYNKTGAGQTRTSTAPAGSTVIVNFRMQNDSDEVQFLSPQGCASTTHFKVKYFLPQSPNPDIDVTNTITSGGLSVGRNPGQTETYRVVVKVKGTAPRGATLNCRLKVTINAKGPNDPRDVALLVVRRGT